MKLLLGILVACVFWTLVCSMKPFHTAYMLNHHLNGTTTVFEVVGPYWPID